MSSPMSAASMSAASMSDELTLGSAAGTSGRVPLPLSVVPLGGADPDAQAVPVAQSAVQFLPAPFTDEQLERLGRLGGEIIARYHPHTRSALMPLLYLVQSEQGYVSADGIAFCAHMLGLTTAQVSGVASFYTMYRRKPCGQYSVGVCTNTLCAVMGGDAIYARLRRHLGLEDDEPVASAGVGDADAPVRGTQLHHPHPQVCADGALSLERLECNAACDYAPVVMVNWEFFDNQTPDSAVALVDSLLAGEPPQPTRGASLRSFTDTQRLLAGFYDGRADEGPSAGPASVQGLRVARGQVQLEPDVHVSPQQAPAQGDADQPMPTDQSAQQESVVGQAGRDRLNLRAHKAQQAGQAGRIPHEQSKDFSGGVGSKRLASSDNDAQDSVAQDSVAQDSVAQDSVAQDSVAQDSVAQDSVSGRAVEDGVEGADDDEELI